MAQREAFLRAAWAEICARRGNTRLMLLLPPGSRRGWAFDEDCPMQEMSGQLLNFEDAVAACKCPICTHSMHADALQLPTCASTRRSLMPKVLLHLSETFESELYSPGDICTLIVARSAAARAERRQHREAARHVIRGARVRMHQLAARKRTVRIEGLRTSMGDEAFEQMVQQQLDARRSRGGGDSQWQESLLWWHSHAGRHYWTGPPCPPRSLVGDVLTPAVAAQHWPAFCHHQDLQRSLVAGSCGLDADVVVSVPFGKVAHFAAVAVDWNSTHGCLGHCCKCTAAIEVQFDPQAGERAPRVYVAGGSTSPLALMDAASLENLHSGQIVSSARRFIGVNGRVVAITGREVVGLALPRPHDQFDTVLRGPSPPTSLLPVGWDITDTASRIRLHVSWPAAPFSTLTLLIEASDEAEEVTDEEINATLEEILAPFHRVSAQRFDTLVNTLLWMPRAVGRLLRSVAHYTARAPVQTFREVVQPSWRIACRAAEFIYDRMLLPCLHVIGHLTRPFRRALGQIGQWCADLCEIGFRVMQRAVHNMSHTAESCVQQFRVVAQAFADSVAQWWAAEPLVRRALHAVSDLVSAAADLARSTGNWIQDLAQGFHDGVTQWWAAQPFLRRAMEYCTDLVCRAVQSGFGAASWLEEACRPLWQQLLGSESWTCQACHRLAEQLAALLQKKQEPVRLARVRRHDDRHALA